KLGFGLLHKCIDPNGELCEYLKGVAEAEDVHSYVKNNGFGIPAFNLNSSGHPEWNFYFRSKYISDLLCKAKMEDSNGIGSPMVSSCRLSRFGTNTTSDATLYRSIVGALQYATLTRPDIAFSVNKVAQVMANPLESHSKSVKHILRYLKGVAPQWFTSSTCCSRVPSIPPCLQ
ncbi:retrovirus-related Pol polyprotein from transposon TNT 1-94, partial [Trifolium pratense]